MTEVADDLADIRTYMRRTGPACSVSMHLTRLPEPVAVLVARALADRSLDATAISAWLKDKHGTYISPESMSRHRNGRCLCGRSG